MIREVMPTTMETNRKQFRSIFNKHQPGKDGRLSYNELLKFCKTAHICPDLLPLSEVKRTCENILGVAFSSKLTLGYMEFERFLYEVSSNAFGESIPMDTKARMLIIQAKPYVETEYGVVLNADRSLKKRSNTARQPTLRRLDTSNMKSSDMQIDLNISAALLALKTTPGKVESSFASSSPTRNRTPDHTPDHASTAAGKLKPRLSETERGQSPSRFVRTARRNLSSTSLNDTGFFSDSTFTFTKVSDGYSPDKPIPVKVRLKNPSTANRRSSPIKTALLDKHRNFMEKRQASSFSSDFVLRLILQMWHLAARTKLLNALAPEID